MAKLVEMLLREPDVTRERAQQRLGSTWFDCHETKVVTRTDAKTRERIGCNGSVGADDDVERVLAHNADCTSPRWEDRTN